MIRLAVAILVLVAVSAPAIARDSLGVFDSWGAFRDPETPRCYAISAADQVRGNRNFRAFASIGFWPKKRVRGQVHFRLSREKAANAAVVATISGRRYTLAGSSADVWPADRRMDSAMVAAIRSATSMRIETRDKQGRAVNDRYKLRGAATAIDAASLGCSRLR